MHAALLEWSLHASQCRPCSAQDMHAATPPASAWLTFIAASWSMPQKTSTTLSDGCFEVGMSPHW